jgi:transporter family protein
MRAWLPYALIAIGFWGVWGLYAKLASRSLNPHNLFLLAFVGNLLVFPCYLAFFAKDFRFAWRNLDCCYAVLSGVVGALGTLFFYLAVSKGEASRVVVVTAMYPVLTVILAAALLREPVTAQKLLGVACALIALTLLS